MLSMLESHKLAARKLDIIKDKAFQLIKQNIGKISEYDVWQYIVSELKEQNLATDKECPIVGVNEGSSIPHYFPPRRSKIIKKNNLILIDIWARLKKQHSLFADIT